MLQINQYPYYDKNGNLKYLQGCSTYNVALLRITFLELYREIQLVDPGYQLDFSVLLEKNERIPAIAKKILSLCGVDSESITYPTLAYFVHSYVDETGQPHNGFLWEIHFQRLWLIPDESEESSEKSEENLTFDEYYHELWSFCVNSNGGSLTKALEDFTTVPMDLVESHLEVSKKHAKKQKENDPEDKKTAFIKKVAELERRFIEDDKKEHRKIQKIQMAKKQKAP